MRREEARRNEEKEENGGNEKNEKKGEGCEAIKEKGERVVGMKSTL